MALPEAFKKSFRRADGLRVYALEPPAGWAVRPRGLDPVGRERVITGANPAAYIYAAGPKFATVLWMSRIERDQRIAKIMVDRLWGATMALTEADAGSDVGAGRTRAVPQPDGSWHLEGVKRFITSGEHDLTEEHHPSGAGATGWRRGGRRSGHQGTLPVHRAQVAFRS